ncbi:unnamed protein product [Paramecium pentaurelia]|uniref:Uncharacterized protein n=1 Tax=Paramecium pentaurelia TaxID=43138 RepID=A0A8S1U0B8_9CILI|nr:unnamed protein product [Paramecium pentaurelia]
MNQSLTVMEKVEQDKMENPQAWIQNNIINSLSGKQWRQNYLQKLGIKQVQEKENSSKEFQLNYVIRTNDDVRNNYIQKLMSNKLMQQQKKHQTLTIFDWDDTLLCTTFLGGYGFVDLPIDVLEQLTALNESASRLLEKASQVGDVFIITNAAQGWVEYSSKLYMNKVFQVIFDKKIVVISARHGYEEMFPGDCGKWKIEAFKDIRSKYENDVFTNLICLGDSNIEIDAAHVLAKEFTVALIKTIKFRECPKPEELVRQLDLVSDKFEQIYTTFKSLTIRLEKKTSGS